MAEVVNGVIDGRRGEVEDLLGAAARLGDGTLELAVTGRRACSGAGHAGVAEVVGLVDQDDVGVLHRAFDVVRRFSPTLQVGVAVADERLEIAGEIGQEVRQQRLPHVFLGGFRREEDAPPAVMGNPALDEHEADVRLPEPHPVAEKGRAVPGGDLDQILVGVALIAGERGEDGRRFPVPPGRAAAGGRGQIRTGPSPTPRTGCVLSYGGR